MSVYHTKSSADIVTELDTDQAKGLSTAAANQRLQEHGPNELTHSESKSPWRIFLDQFGNLLVILLIVAALVSFGLGDVKDGIAILVIVVLNALLGFKQEYNAEKAMAALKKLSAPVIRVRRGGEVCELDAKSLVPGDVVLLEAGNLVPADARLVDSASLRVMEAALTGESEGVGKHTDPIAGEDIPVGDRRNMVYMGTVVTYGRGEAVVTGTGMDTELGRVATLLQTTEDEATPLSKKLHRLGKQLVVAALILIGLVAVIGLVRGADAKTVFLTAVSMAVAAVPEGLPAVVTIALALGAQRMLKRRALIRQLPAVETLGSVTAICTDKTGTLTQNRMTATSVQLPGKAIDLPPSLAEPVTLPDDDAGDAALLLAAAALCSDAVLKADESGTPTLEAIGDPTEGALVVAAARAGLDKAAMESHMPRTGEAPFDSDRKRMATLHTLPAADSGLPAAVGGIVASVAPARGVVFVKGAIDSLIDVSTAIRIAGKVEPLNDARREQMLARMSELAGNGIRVLGVAYRPTDETAAPEHPRELERELVLLGLVGMMDPLRDEVKDAVATCRGAGIRTVMITGDHPLMAGSIGKELGIVDDGGVLTGRELEGLSDEALQAAVAKTNVFARVSPEHKLRIVDALQARGEIASMTGDGVNDAPALKSADIGVAMGITGTDVAKEASDMVLLDDMFTAIVAAVAEGRVIFDNIRRFIRFILAANAGELLVMLLAPFFGMPIPLLPVQILWMNLVTDGLPALALGVEKAESDVMKRPPRNPDAPIIGWRMGRQIIWVGLLMACLSLAVGYSQWRDRDTDHGDTAVAAEAGGEVAPAGHHGEHALASTWQTMLFTTMVFTQLFLALGVRSSRDSLFKIGPFSNRPLVGALALTVALQFAVIYVPILQSFFRTRPLTAPQLGVCFLMGAGMLIAVEVEKLVRRRLES